MCSHVNAQFGSAGFELQVAVADGSGAFYTSTPVSVRATLYNVLTPSQTIYQEDHAVTSSSIGTINLTIGAGTANGTGVYNALDAIPFDLMLVGLRLEFDVLNDGSYDITQEAPMQSVPYSMHSRSNAEVLAFGGDMLDYDTTNNQQLNQSLQWDGSAWQSVPSTLSDTAQFATNVGAANDADTTGFACVAIAMNVDTAMYAYHADSSNYAETTLWTQVAANANFADTAAYAVDAYAWGENGNGYIEPSRGAVLGSTSNEPVEFRTNNTPRMTIDTAGRVYINAADSLHALNVYGSSIATLLVESELDSGVHHDLDPGTYFYWSSKKGSLHIGTTEDTLWTESNTGINSFSFGRNSWVRSNYSAAIGDSCVVQDLPEPTTGVFLHQGHYALAMGRRCESNGRYAFASGYETKSTNARSIAMGYQAIVANEGYASVAIGKGARVDAHIVSGYAIGTDVFADGRYTTALGTSASTDSAYGSFVYGDFSTTDTVTPPTQLPDQFIVRCAGGAIFYSDSIPATGVSLAAGAGAWATLSDSTKKENFTPLDYEEVLLLIDGLPVYYWNYKSQSDSIVHLGPMAQDYFAAFGLGESDTTITTTDLDGVVMAGIKALNSRLNTIDQRLDEVDAGPTGSIEDKYEEMNARVDAIELHLQHLQETKEQ
jgi:hypothetical protein